MMRILRRRVIIRETDFHKVRKSAFSPISTMGLLEILYDRADWQPITRESIEREVIMKGLTGEQMPRGGSWLIPEDYLLYARDSLYNGQYTKWHPRYDEDGYMIVKPRSNLPAIRLGWAVFEKDLESRL